MCEAATVDVEGFEDFVNGTGRDVTGNGPVEDVEILFTRGELIQDDVEQFALRLKLTLEQAKSPRSSSTQKHFAPGRCSTHLARR